MRSTNHEPLEIPTTEPSIIHIKQYLFIILGVIAIAVGVLAICFGSFWSAPIFAIMKNIGISSAFEVVVPFFSIFITMLGAYIIVTSRH
ncbi:hypothetical protein RI845_01595 [Thalassotalea nanhaiensis]|uniref:Uncharacterized protein n=1 Tax=Thalassotalea nanhaiensis TaxID=3065648 RepID=A0ABY9TJS9_9GAMM|nr:hypothetical protein RI845_01595 [Colwelliaceae bacterium SQ345]